MYIKQKLGIKIFMVALGALLILLPLIGCAAPAGPKTLVFADVNWDSIQVHNRIAGFILEHGYGYQSEFVPGETIPLAAAQQRGDIDITMEFWVESCREAFRKAIASGEVVKAGTNFPDSWQGWLVPTYVVKGDAKRGIEPMAPDLKSVFDLPKYWELFKDPEDPTKGRYYGCQPGTSCQETDEKKFEAYGLNDYYNIFQTGSNAARDASMVAAHMKGEPWFGYSWEPTWVLGTLDMTKIEEPPYDEELWRTTRACAYPPDHVEILVHVSLLDRAPEVVEFLGKYRTTLEHNNKALAYMREQGGDTQAAAIWFLKEKESVWTKWVPSDVASKVKAALP